MKIKCPHNRKTNVGNVTCHSLSTFGTLKYLIRELYDHNIAVQAFKEKFPKSSQGEEIYTVF